MGHDMLPELPDFWSTSVFYESQFMKLTSISRDRSIAIRSALHFTRNEIPESANDNEGSESATTTMMHNLYPTLVFFRFMVK